jgi:hypothetical protein
MQQDLRLCGAFGDIGTRIFSSKGSGSGLTFQKKRLKICFLRFSSGSKWICTNPIDLTILDSDPH